MSNDMIHKTLIAETKAIDAEAGIYEAMISTEDVDRDSDVIRADGADLSNYLRNPVVLFGHNYYEAQAVVGKALEIERMPGVGIRARWQFAGPEVSEEADLVHRLWAGGFLNATSIGFIPREWKEREDENGEKLRRGYEYTKWELLEFSIVPVPANQNALRLMAKGLSMGGETMAEYKAVVPYADHGTSETDWSAPTLADFTSEAMADLSLTERRRIAAHYTWTANMPPEAFTDLKLPHHRAAHTGVGPAIWRGVAAAMAVLLGGRGGVDIPDGDRRGVYNHLARHYAQFDKEPPEFRQYADEELRVFFEIEQQSEPEANENDDNELPPEALDALSDLVSGLQNYLNPEEGGNV